MGHDVREGTASRGGKHRTRWGRGLLMTALTVALLVLHQDAWNWTKARPLLAGVMPVGLWYHALYSIACAVLMWLFVWLLWPRDLEQLEKLPPKHDGEGH